MSREHSKAHVAMMHSFAQPDEHSYGVFKMLNDVYPAFAKKLFENNDLMKTLVMTGYNPMDILDYPVCGKCETLAAPDGYAIKNGRQYCKCLCFAKHCGATTVNPISLRKWMKYELKKRVSEDFFDAIEVSVDSIAAAMLQRYQQETSGIIKQHNNMQREKRNIVLLDGTEVNPTKEPPIVQHYHDGKPHIPKDAIEIPDNIDAEEEGDE